MTGSTQESAFPANFGPYRLTISGRQDGFVAKLQGDVYNRDYAAIFGGSGSDQGDDIQVDRQGNVWIAGLSDSYDFPGSANDQHIIVKQDVNASGGTVTITVRNLSNGASFNFKLPYNFTAAQLQAKIDAVYPSVTVTVNAANFDVFVPYPTKLTISIDSFDTWARLTNTPIARNAYFFQGGKPTAASGGTFTLSGFYSNSTLKFTTTPIAYNCTPAVLAAALKAATGGANWTAGFDPLLAAGTTPAFPANGIIVLAPAGASIATLDQGALTGGQLYVGQFAIDSINTDKSHSAPNGGTFSVNGAGPQILWGPPPLGGGFSMKAKDLQDALTATLAAHNWRYALVLPSDAVTPSQDLVVYAAVEGTTLTTPLAPPIMVFSPSDSNLSRATFTLTPRPNYYSNSVASTYHRYGFLMRWKADINTVLTPEVGKEKVLTWSCKDANVTINGFRIFKSNDTPSNEKVPFLIAGTNFDPNQIGTAQPATSPVDYAAINPSGRLAGTIKGYTANASYSYRLRLTFDPTTNIFNVLNTPASNGLAASGYDGDSAAARVVTRGSTVDSFGNQVIAGTVYYGSNFDTRNAGSPFKTTGNVYNSDGFDGRLLRRNDIFVRKYDPNGVLLSSCLVGGNSNDEAGGYNIPKEMVVFPDPLSAAYVWPSGGGISFQEMITGSSVAVDGQNNVYVTGIARSFDFPRTRGVFGETFDQFNRVTVTKLAPDLSALIYSTHLNANNAVYPGGIAVGPGGNAYVTGNIHPWSVDFPHPGSTTDTWANAPTGTGDSNIFTTPDALRPAYLKTNTPDIPGGDGWLTVLNSTATGVVYSSYIGSELDDVVYQPFVDSFGDCWVSGWSCTRRDILVWPSHTATAGTRYLVDSNLGTLYGGGQSQITELAFKTNTDLSTQSESNIAYGILDTRIGAQDPLVFPPTDAPYPGYYTEARDGLLQRYRLSLPVLQRVTFDKPTLAGGLGNNATGFVTLSAPAPAPGMSIVLKMKNNSAASFSSQGPVYQTVITIPTQGTVGSVPIYTNTVAALTSVDISASFEGDIKIGRLVVAPWFSSLSLTPNSAVGGQTVQGRVRLFENAPANGAGVPVSVVSSDTNLATVPASVTVPAGQQEVGFDIKTTGVKTASIVQISASFAGYGAQRQLTLTPASLFSLTFDPAFVDGKTSAIGTIKLDGNSGTKFTVKPVGLPAGYSVSPNPIVFDPAQADPSTRTFTLNTPFLSTDNILKVTLVRSDDPSQTLTGTINVIADPVTTISVNANPVAGGDPTSVTVGLSTPAGKGGALVHVTSTSGAALLTSSINGALATSVLARVKEGDTTVTIPVTTKIVYADTLVNFSADRGTAATGVPNGIVKTTTTPLTIKGIGVTLTLNPNSVPGGTASQGTVTLSHAAPVGGLSVALKAANATIAKVPSAVTVPAGATTASFTINTIQPLNGQTTTTTISATLGSKVGTAALTIRAPQAASISFNPSTVTGGNTTVGTVKLDVAAPSAGSVVSLTSSNTAAAKVPATVTVPGGKTSVSFNVVSGVVTGSATTTVTATVNGASVSTVLSVVSANIANVSLSPTSVTGGNSCTCTVTLNTAAPIGGAVISLTLSNGTIASIPATLSIPAGQVSGQVTITTQAVSRPLSTVVTAKYKASQGSASLLITP